MRKNKKEIISTKRNKYGPSMLCGSVRNIAKKILGKRGFIEVDIISKWEIIVGKELAKNTIAQKIIFKKGRRDGGTLHLLVSNGAFALELQHKEPTIISRINSFFGYKAIEKIKISQGYWEQSTKKDNKKNKNDKIDFTNENDEVKSKIKDISNDDLKSSLDLLGKLIYSKNESKNE